MRATLAIMQRIWSREWWSLTRGTVLMAIVVLAGIALLGLSGWFITAAGMAGLAGIGIGFDMFRPSAGVRFLALGRTAARYGERMLTHDATLRSLARLRVQLLSALASTPFARLPALRASKQLNRITQDVDALDGIALRLFIPAISAALALLATAVALALLVDGSIVVGLLASYTPGVAFGLGIVAWRSRRSSRSAQFALNAFRTRLIDLLRSATELTVFGRLGKQTAYVMDAERRMREAAMRNDRIERAGGLVLSLVETVAASFVLLSGALLAYAGTLDPARAALAFFATLALAKTLGPLRRGMTELGKMADAAGRVNRMLEVGEKRQVAAGSVKHTPTIPCADQALVMRKVGFGHEGAATQLIEGLNLSVRAGETVALAGPSGTGKTTVLHLAAGMHAARAGTVEIDGKAIGEWHEAALREIVSLLPQRSALLSGTIREALDLARPGLDDSQAWAVLSAVALDSVIGERGGLESRLEESGAGLSGGESRRLALARVLLRHPRLLLLDEPTEGLDGNTARKVLRGIRQYLPDAGILLASHRQAEREFADRVQKLEPVMQE